MPNYFPNVTKRNLYVKGARKRRNKYRKHRAGMAPVPRGSLMSFPLQRILHSKTRYQQQFFLDPGVGGTPDTQVFSLNGLYDVDISGVGHSALGFDQLSLMYDHYCVTRCKVRIQAVNMDSTYTQQLIASIKDRATVSTDLDAIVENGRCISRHMAQNGNTSASQVINLTANMNSFFGREVRQGDKYQGGSAANPSDQCYLHVTAEPTNAADAGQIKCIITFQFDTVWTEPKLLSSS